MSPLPKGNLIGPFPQRFTDDAGQTAYDRMRRRVLWAMPSGLYLIGSISGQKRNLMTANLVLQLSLSPKLVGASIENESVTHGLITESLCFSVSLIGEDDRALLRRFAKPATRGPQPGQLSGADVFAASTGAPVLSSALGWLDCAVTQIVPLGSHSLFIGEVVDAGEAGNPAQTEKADQPQSLRPLTPVSSGPQATVKSEAQLGAPLSMADTRMNYGG